MAIRFSCVACGKRLAVKDENAGRRSRCPRCGGEIIVPAPVASARMANGADEPPPVRAAPIAIGDDWKRSPEAEVPIEIPGLRASPDDEDDEASPIQNTGSIPSCAPISKLASA